MRRFFLENEAGVRVALNNESGVFLSAPTGLGVTLNPAFADLRKGFFRETSGDKEPQSAIVCELVFTGDAYVRYREFADWCAAARELYLVYQPFGNTEFRRGVRLGYMTKTELTATRWLNVPVSFACITPWYRAAPSRMSMTEEAGEVMRYSFAYTPTLIYSASSSGGMAADVSAGGHIPAAFVLTYTGAILNPRVTLKGASTGATYGICSISANIPGGSRLELSTRYGDSYVRVTDSGGEASDLLDCVDLSFEPFPRVPITEDCVLLITADDVITGTAAVSVYYYYRSV